MCCLNKIILLRRDDENKIMTSISFVVDRRVQAAVNCGEGKVKCQKYDLEGSRSTTNKRSTASSHARSYVPPREDIVFVR